MGNFVDTASDDGVFNSDSWDGDGITSLCCLALGTEGEYPGNGKRWNRYDGDRIAMMMASAALTCSRYLGVINSIGVAVAQAVRDRR